MIRVKDGRARLRAIPAALLALAALGLPAAAEAVAPPVTNTNDSGPGSLRDSIDTAVNGDTVTVPPGTYTLTSGELLVDTYITVQGAGAGSTIIRAAGDFRVFQVDLTVNGSQPEGTIRGVTITGGRAPSSTFEGGGGILATGNTILTVEQSVIRGNSASSPGASTSGHGGGGIAQESTGSLTLIDSTVSGNSVSYGPGGTGNGGGGVFADTGELVIGNSTISGNSVSASGTTGDVGGGGVYSGGDTLTLVNSTVSGNTATVPAGASNGGGGILSNLAGSGVSFLLRATVAGNTTTGSGGGLLVTGNESIDTVAGSLLSANTPLNCATASPSSISTGGNNAESGNSCNFSPASSDLIGVDPQLGPLDDNGGPTATHAVAPGSPIIDFASCGQTALVDQRGVARPKGTNCEPGAYEFDGLSSVPDSCSTTGNLPVSLFPPAGSSATAARFRIDGGPEAGVPASGNAAIVQVPAGTHSLEFWGEFAPSGQELEHHLRGMLVDPTGPLLRITSDQGRNGYTVGETASFSVAASDALSGLASDPSVRRRPLNTSNPRTITIRRTATDGCGNATTRQLVVTVLPKPVFGKRVNLVPLSGQVFIQLPGGGGSSRAGARASQKGRPFIPLRKARQVPVGSLIDTRKGRVRLVSARDARARRIQAGQFYSGVFQVLQARKRSLKGLTTLRLKGSSFNPCRPRRGSGAQAALSRRAIRRLRARANGRFRTRGRYSAATVRGTIWTTTDRCDGTLTKVARGRVAVRDFRRRKTIVVRRGKSYLAKAPVR